MLLTDVDQERCHGDSGWDEHDSVALRLGQLHLETYQLDGGAEVKVQTRKGQRSNIGMAV